MSRPNTTHKTEKTRHASHDHVLRVRTETDFNPDGSTFWAITDWHFSSPSTGRLARVCRNARASDAFCEWFVQLYRDASDHRNPQMNHHTSARPGGSNVFPSTMDESRVWTAAREVSLAWVLRGENRVAELMVGWEIPERALSFPKVRAR